MTDARSWDLRLVPAAIGSWLTALALVSVPNLAHPATIIAILCIFSIVLGVLLRSRGDTIGAARLRWISVTLAVVCVVALGASIAMQPQRSGPIKDAAAQRLPVSVTLTIKDDGRFRPATGFGDAGWEHRAHISRLSSRLGDWRVEATILLRIAVDDSDSADRSPAPPAGSVIITSGRLGEAAWNPQVAAVLQSNSDLTVISVPGPIDSIVNSVRSGLRSALSSVPPRSGSLIAGLAIGDESTQPAELGEQMRVSGLSHLTAVSGGNIAILLGAVIITARLLGLAIWIRAVAGAVAVLGYVLIVGPEPSVLRAAGMGTVAVIAIIVGGPRRGIPALAATIIVLLVLAPTLAVSLGFSLSVFATTGLLVVAPLMRDRLHAVLERITHGRVPRLSATAADAIALTTAAQITTAPLIASLGTGLSLVAVPANVLAAPAVAPVTLLGLLAATTAPWLPPLGAIFGHLAAPAAGWIAWWAMVLSDLPGATLPWPGGVVGVLLVLVIAAGITLVVFVSRGRSWPLRTMVVAAIAMIAVFVLRPPDRAGWPPPDWVGVACDVGQGDGFVISVAEASAVVIDTGPDPEAIDRCLTELGIEHVAALVLTHFHFDHVGGTPGVLRGRQVDDIIVSPVRQPLDQAEAVDQWADAAGVPINPTSRGEVRRLGQDVQWQVLWPQRVINQGSIPNNASVVLVVAAQGIDFLLLGDVEPEAQVALRVEPLAQQVNVVKVAHHGSRYQDPRLPAWSGGQVAIVSVGADNGYGHPAPETLDAWSAQSGHVYRTDQHGDIAVVTDAGADSGWGVVARR